MKKIFVIGITGTFGSGKSVASDFFESKGFKKIVLSSFLEEELKNKGIKKITRKLLQDLGNKWRKEYGAGILAQKALDLARKEKIKKIVIDGIRNVGEIDIFQNKNNFCLIAILSDRKIRFERLKKLKRRENLYWSLFERLDRWDLGLGQKKAGLRAAECISLSDMFVTNNESKRDFIKKLENVLKDIQEYK